MVSPLLSPLRILLAVLFTVFVSASPSRAETVAKEVQTSWRLLDYIAVDYRGAVTAGRVVNAAEYNEMVEFSDSVSERLAALPETPARGALRAKAAKLQAAISDKSEPAVVAASARELASSLLVTYPVPLAPDEVPDIKRGAALYKESCASCHGVNGEGPRGAFAQLDPAPIAFADRDRARDRSIFGLYQVISQGLEGTAMQSFANLPEADRWALAFHVGGVAYRDVAQGERIWNSEEAVRKLVPNLAALAALTPAELEAKIGRGKAASVTAYLRARPEAVTTDRAGSLQLARERLRQSADAYGRGDRDGATNLALSAYLDGFEPVEAVLATRDGELMTRVEQAMAGFRTAIAGGASEQALRQRLSETELLLDDADKALAPEAESAASTFFGAFFILLREGLEALLVVIAMVAFLRKADRKEALPYVHGGWVAALIAGAATWAVATYFIGISGANRELTEGFGSLLAAVILLSVGIWMHGKSQAEEWRRYIATKMQGALSRGSAWFLFGLAFIVVYREVFETILFYAALWTPDNGATILAGAFSGLVVLSALAWVMLRYSRKLPITQFFAYSSILIAVLAIVLAGKGVGALQEAGLIPVTPIVGLPRVAMLGFFPTAEAIFAQLGAFATVAFGFYSTRAKRADPLPAE